MINAVIPLVDAIPTSINIWTYVIPIIVSAITGAIVAIGTKILDRPKTLAEEDKIKIEVKKTKVEIDAIQNEET